EENPKIVIGVVVVLLLAAGAYFGGRYWIDTRDQEAQTEMFQAIRYFEKDNLDTLELALNGDGNNLGFLQIIDDYKWPPAASLANFYAG
ncbi:MAG TPA: cytochrome C biosynthesis protein, partial [Cytophagales bacterium]|nr:cytochrome C biosynthesis protein [Cytophagales bacterium]